MHTAFYSDNQSQRLFFPNEIARLPGERAKIAVETFDERIDPVGACVGVLRACTRSAANTV